MTENYKLNIRPTTKTYAYFTNLSYQEEYALAEFIDNSTASFYLHKDQLAEEARSHKVTIIINYDNIADTITVHDDAFGMELSEFKNAILLDSSPETTGGRNEFGYGLKTAATWFGKHWEVRSSRFGSENGYCAYLDIDEIMENDIDEININKFDENYDAHYTTITISKLNRHLKTNQIKKRIVDTLKSIYRRDLKSGNVEIIYNGQSIEPSDYPILTNFRGQDWRKQFHLSFVYEGTVYNANGMVEIITPGKYSETGFALFRRGRVVVDHFKPKEIYRQSQSFISLRLRGEIDMDDFPVAQAKNQFAWTDELKELFIKNLKESILDYIVVSNYSNKEIEREKNPPISSEDDDEKNDQVKSEVPLNNSDNYSKKENKEKDVIELTPNMPPEHLKPETSNQPLTTDKRVYNLRYEDSVFTFMWQNKENSTKFYTFDKTTRIVNVYMPNSYKSGKRSAETMSSIILLGYIISQERCLSFADDSGKLPIAIINNQLSGIIDKIEVIEDE